MSNITSILCKTVQHTGNNITQGRDFMDTHKRLRKLMQEPGCSEYRLS